jgi:hypothetical protein
VRRSKPGGCQAPAGTAQKKARQSRAVGHAERAALMGAALSHAGRAIGESADQRFALTAAA